MVGPTIFIIILGALISWTLLMLVLAADKWVIHNPAKAGYSAGILRSHLYKEAEEEGRKKVEKGKAEAQTNLRSYLVRNGVSTPLLEAYLSEDRSCSVDKSVTNIVAQSPVKAIPKISKRKEQEKKI